MRGIDVFLNAVPGASLVAMRHGLRSVGITSPRIVGYTEPRANSGCAVPDAEHRDDVRHDVARPARLGPDGDRGAAGVAVRGRRLLVPLRRRHGHRRPRPGRGRQVPVPAARLRRRGARRLLHLPLPDVHQLGGAAGARRRAGDEADQDLSARRGRQPGRERVRQHRRARSFNTVHANDFSFYEEVNELVQEEPVEALDAERAGQLAAIGIVKGQPFAPDDRMRGILDQAATIGAGMARALAYAPRDPEAVLYGSWKNAFVGGSHEFLRDGARLLDARTPVPLHRHRHHPGDGARAGRRGLGVRLHRARRQRRPARRRQDLPAPRRPGPAGQELLGGRRLRHPDPLAAPGRRRRPTPRSPATPGPSRPTTTAPTTSTSGPRRPTGKESNWVETLPGKSWFPIFRLYGPLEPWFDQTWKLNEFEPIG